ncbi:Uncharacterised protein [Legionella jordanis]|nr:Uncharacterised protein [Legionella jordanis]
MFCYRVINYEKILLNPINKVLTKVARDQIRPLEKIYSKPTYLSMTI